MLGLYCKNLGGVGAGRGGQGLLGALTLQLYVLIWVLFGQVWRETKDVFKGLSQGSNEMIVLIFQTEAA